MKFILNTGKKAEGERGRDGGKRGGERPSLEKFRECVREVQTKDNRELFAASRGKKKKIPSPENSPLSRENH